MLYTTSQIGIILDITPNAVLARAKILGIKHSSLSGKKYQFTESQMRNICSQSTTKPKMIFETELISIPKVIYVDTTYNIYESKINFMEV